ncbi:MAG: Hsp33 family molecular chaperone HslO [Pseudobdellovibrionaceae bacterium]
MSRVHRFVTNDLTVRVAAVDATAVVAEMQNIQNSAPLATIGVGRAMVGALLMSSQLKDGQEVGILLKGNGPLGSLYGQASYEGHVRGYCPHPSYFPPHEEDALNLRKAIGFGHLTVSRQQPYQRQPFFGTVEMASGEVGDDIAHYLHQSHQIRSLVSLGVLLDPKGKVRSAGGVLLEVMPGVEETVVERIQENADSYKENVSQELSKGKSLMDLVSVYLKGIPFGEISHDFPIQYFCPCTQERVISSLGTLGLSDLQEMIEAQETTEVTCQMCGRKYSVSVEELKELKDLLHRNSMH